MGRLRSCNQFPFDNSNFIIVVIALLVVFLLYVFQFMVRIGQSLIIPWLVITCCFFALTIWSYIAVVLTEPGDVPVYYGMYDQNSRERKYCIVCHNFKPDRSHHCSKCNKCLLNMDHHCPWINNCVGFYNRKYFLLFIFYLLITLALAIYQMGVLLFNQIINITQKLAQTNIHSFICFVQFIVCVILFCFLFVFFVTHVRMVLQNSTTIEEMLRERKKRMQQQSGIHPPSDLSLDHNQFDINPWYNFTQVFGQNIMYWFVPIQDEILRGKGIHWDRNTDSNYCQTVHGGDLNRIKQINDEIDKI